MTLDPQGLRNNPLVSGVYRFMSKPSSSTTIGKVIFVATGLLVFSVEAFRAAEREYELQAQEFGSFAFTISDLPSATSDWEILGLILFIGSLACAIAAFMLWRNGN